MKRPEFCHHCVCWWPGTIRCQAISRHSADYINQTCFHWNFHGYQPFWTLLRRIHEILWEFVSLEGVWLFTGASLLGWVCYTLPTCIKPDQLIHRDSEIGTSCGRILKFPTNTNINDGTHSQWSGTHNNHCLWVPGTHKKVNNFESLVDNHNMNSTNLQLSYHDLKRWDTCRSDLAKVTWGAFQKRIWALKFKSF